MASTDGLDSLLNQIGTGRWNYLVFFTASMMPGLMPIFLIGSEFLNPKPTFTCDVPNDNNTLPVNGSQCLMMVDDHQGDYDIVPCNKWIYDKSVFHSTISMEWDLVCDRAWISPVFQVILTVGAMLGYIMGAAVADKYGRRMNLRIGSFLLMAITILMVFVPWISLILVARFLQGIMVGIMLLTSFILAMEMCKPSLRTIIGIVVAMPYALGMMTLSGIAYLLPDWRWIQVLGVYPILLILPLSLYIDESPRWLVVTGRVDEAVKVFQRAVRLNKSKLPDDMDLHAHITNIHKRLTNGGSLGEAGSENTSACESCGAGSEDQVDCMCPRRSSLGPDDGFGSWWSGPVALFRTSVMRKIMLVLLAMRFMQGMIYIGLPLYSGAFSSPFLYVALLGVVEIPAYSVTAPITNWLGRKKVVIPCLIMAGVSLLISLAIEEMGIHKEWLHMLFVVLSYFMACTAYGVNYLYASELMPTTLRPWGATACILSSYIAYCITPYITDTSTSSNLAWLTPSVLGTGGVIGGSLIFLLPETNGRDLPETVRDLRDRLEREKSQMNGGLSDRLFNSRMPTSYESI